ncbi:class I SAM-dependent methyltransferase [Pedobacter nototheniae]|uniref:class I SAM-dependent methyltransferase n=1 Tax=Pedobacter nototheniae TaxID=2488994 RepID=UPI001038AAD7|nr:class I SAM-dependent methyltransferase [Pedobacter nototheniae]
MKENKYDDEAFFNQYNQMSRSVKGLSGAGEWHELKKMLPDFKNKKVLDLGCGFGWHCKYAANHGASQILGIDLSENMLKKAMQVSNAPSINYQCIAIEDYTFPAETFDVVISSLAFHYLKSFDDISLKIYKSLVANGTFIFSVEHPIFTASGKQDWYYDDNGNILHWAVDRYFTEGIRKTSFLGEEVIKYHRTLTTYIASLLKAGFEIIDLVEPQPNEESLETIPAMKDELRRPMFLIVSARKK